MSKNISIQEGGTAKQMTVNKLKTDKVGGGTCLWVPEEEVSLGTKSISANGTYKASDDGKYGFSQVTVNVSGGQGSVNSDGTPNVNPVNPNDPDSKVNPGGPGTSVVGTDPVTGNDYVIGVDEDGQLVTTPVPSVIEITENPTKTDYNDGDAVDPTGLVAVLKNNDGTIFTNEDYPDGTIPLNELILSTSTIRVDDSGEIDGEISGGISVSPVEYPIPYSYGSASCNVTTEKQQWVYNGSAFFAGYKNGKKPPNFTGTLIIGSSQSTTVVQKTIDEGHEKNASSISLSKTYTYDGKTVYYATSAWSDWGASPAGMNGGATLHDVPAASVAWALVYGQGSNIGSTQQLPIQWKSPYDGRTFETNVEVTVTGSGFSDDSGGSSSGGGTGF